MPLCIKFYIRSHPSKNRFIFRLSASVLFKPQFVHFLSAFMNLFFRCVLFFAHCVSLHACSNSQVDTITPTQSVPQTPKAVKPIVFKTLRTYSHDRSFFTQGFCLDKGLVYEGTGRFGRSGIFVYPIQKGIVQQKKMLSEEYFGEGITVLKDKIYQLTWQNHVCFLYDKMTLKKLKTFQLKTEGWGITHDQKSLIVSDGSAFIYFYNPLTFELERKIQVKNEQGLVEKLNELEYINGSIFANVWMTNQIVQIDPQSGSVIGIIDVTDLLASVGFDNSKNPDAVLNGIAYNAQSNTIYLTGKLWPIIFEIQLL